SVQKFLRSIPVSGGTVMTARDMVLTAKVAASMTKDHAGPTVATSTPEIAGPMTQVALRERPMRAFACCSFSGLPVCGVRAEWATVRVAKARATGTRASPMAEIPWPIQSRRKLVWVRGDRADGRRIGSILVQLAVPDGRLR